MPKVSGRKPPATRTTTPAQEVGGTPLGEALRSSSTPTPKRPSDESTPQSGNSTRGHKRVKTLSGRHKSRHGEGGSPSHSRGKESAESTEELEAPVELAEEPVAPVFRRPKSMKDLCGTSVQKDDEGYYARYMSDLALQDPDDEMRTRWESLKNSTKVWDDLGVATEFKRGLLHPQLATELYMLPSEVLLAQAAKEMVLVITKLMSRPFRLFQLESVQAELPRRAIDDYKVSAGFKEGLKRMGQVLYEYGYRVALAHFCALHPDLEVAEDPFTIH
ncbi:hypothetical protein BHM03_00034662 [Ensete ventricosum]|nr:hypothetical protein BHM03_00034662 [Ensete ventricosum]